MEFMSPEHVAEMNRRLAASDEVRAAAAKLPQTYVMLYRLHDGPDGGYVFWSTEFSPSKGVTFGLEERTADLVLNADWRGTVNASAAAREGREIENDVVALGDFDMVNVIAEVFTVSREVATVDVTFP